MAMAKHVQRTACVVFAAVALAASGASASQSYGIASAVAGTDSFMSTYQRHLKGLLALADSVPLLACPRGDPIVGGTWSNSPDRTYKCSTLQGLYYWPEGDSREQVDAFVNSTANLILYDKQPTDQHWCTTPEYVFEGVSKLAAVAQAEGGNVFLLPPARAITPGQPSLSCKLGGGVRPKLIEATRRIAKGTGVTLIPVIAAAEAAKAAKGSLSTSEGYYLAALTTLYTMVPAAAGTLPTYTGGFGGTVLAALHQAAAEAARSPPLAPTTPWHKGATHIENDGAGFSKAKYVIGMKGTSTERGISKQLAKVAKVGRTPISVQMLGSGNAPPSGTTGDFSFARCAISKPFNTVSGFKHAYCFDKQFINSGRDFMVHSIDNSGYQPADQAKYAVEFDEMQDKEVNFSPVRTLFARVHRAKPSFKFFGDNQHMTTAALQGVASMLLTIYTGKEFVGEEPAMSGSVDAHDEWLCRKTGYEIVVEYSSLTRAPGSTITTTPNAPSTSTGARPALTTAAPSRTTGVAPAKPTASACEEALPAAQATIADLLEKVQALRAELEAARSCGGRRGRRATATALP